MECWRPIQSVILINGPPRAGKSTLATALQNGLSGPWLIFGLDAVVAMTNPVDRPGIGLRPGADRDGTRRRYYRAWANAVNGFTHGGFGVIADTGIYESDLWTEVRGMLAPSLTVKLSCSVAEIVRRRDATGWNPPHEPGATLWSEAFDAELPHDIEFDTGQLAVQDMVETLRKLWKSDLGNLG